MKLIPRWGSHYPKGWLFGWTRMGGVFLLHLGPGYLEWGLMDGQDLIP